MQEINILLCLSACICICQLGIFEINNLKRQFFWVLILSMTIFRWWPEHLHPDERRAWAYDGYQVVLPIAQERAFSERVSLHLSLLGAEKV
jgi:hypothetical protein